MSKGLLKLDVTKAFSKQSDSHIDQGTVQISFDLPSGKKDSMEFRMDQTIGHAKILLESRYNIPFSSIELELNGSLLADPLSFNDFPLIKSSKKASIGVKFLSGSGGDENEAVVEKEQEHKGGEEEEIDDLVIADD